LAKANPFEPPHVVRSKKPDQKKIAADASASRIREKILNLWSQYDDGCISKIFQPILVSECCTDELADSSAMAADGTFGRNRNCRPYTPHFQSSLMAKDRHR
jgi:hypothetical protein